MDYYYLSLIILFFATNVFWAAVCLKLINKLMSRNYMDYQVAETVKDSKKTKTKEQNNSTPIYEDFSAMSEVVG